MVFAPLVDGVFCAVSFMEMAQVSLLFVLVVHQLAPIMDDIDAAVLMIAVVVWALVVLNARDFLARYRAMREKIEEEIEKLKETIDNTKDRIEQKIEQTQEFVEMTKEQLEMQYE